VSRASAAIAGMTERVDLLINNAGNLLDRRQITEDGFEATYQVNHLAPFLMTAKLLPLLLPSANPRIITLSSIGHSMIDDMNWDDLQLDREFSPFRAYAQSKLANILFTCQIARRHADSALIASAVHPGLVASDFPNKADASTRHHYQEASTRGEALSPDQGADTVLWLALDPAVGAPSGGYFHLRERVAPSAAAVDPEAAERLWAISERQLAPYLSPTCRGDR